MKRFAVSTNSYTDPTIVAGKRYEVFDWDHDSNVSPMAFFKINVASRNGEPFRANCIAFAPCAYLDDALWTIIEEEEPTDDN